MIDDPMFSQKRRLILHSLLVAPAALFGREALAGEAKEMSLTQVTLGTATRGGGFEVYGEAVRAVLADTDPGLRVVVRATRGSKENLKLLEAGEIDLGLIEGNAARDLFMLKPGPSTPRIVAAMYPNPGMFIVRGDKSHRSIADLRGKPVAFGTRASGLTLLAREVLGGLGLDPDRDFQAVYLEQAKDGPALVLDGKVEALWGGGLAWPGFLKVASGPKGARFIVPTAEEIGRIGAARPFLKRMTVPAGSYPGQDQPLQSVGLWSFMLARAGLADELAARVARSLHRSEAALAKRLPQAAWTTAANTAAEAPRLELLHPGVARYLREAGLLPPAG